MTITEIAKLANVSKSSVSLVLNNKPGVSERTRAKVLGIIKKYRYRPNQIAQSLAGGETKSIGLIVKEIDNPYFGRLMRGVYDACSKLGYTVLLGSSEQSTEKEAEIIRTMLSKRVDGLIISPIQNEDADYSYLVDLTKDAFPLVILGSMPNFPTNSVDIDNFAAAFDATSHLIRLGHKNITHLAGPSGHGLKRLEGFRAAMQEYGLPLQKHSIISVQPYTPHGYQAGKELFALTQGSPTAVFCYNDLVAIGLMNALLDLGIDVPGRVSIMGFDDIDIAEHLRIPLSTVRMPSYEIGTSAADLLISRLAEGASPRIERITLAYTLIERRSVARMTTPVLSGAVV
ncbi:MAG: LacI family DNA-binding transcriptional regulator [Ignavibacteriae bacterium]|nr:LacI family DNA-binding transcriptional regulator [Ignavibacteriota bacterium]